MEKGFPNKQGMYDPHFEHDGCGVGFIAHIKGEKSKDIVEKGLHLLRRLEHRGALGADPETGDGAGILTQIPHDFFVSECQSIGIELPRAGEYGVGMIFMPQSKEKQKYCGEQIESMIVEEGLRILGWRNVPVDVNYVGKQAKEVMPVIKEIFVAKQDFQMTADEFERRLYVTRKQIRTVTRSIPDFYITSFSSRTIIHKGMLTPDQLGKFYTDLSNPNYKSALALAHTRFPTNTFPRWSLAQPFRRLAHNGEINTLRGNINWMKGRQSTIQSPIYNHIQKLFPLIIPMGSDSACLDNTLEFLTLSGYSLAHAMMMLVPEAWEHNPEMTPEKAAFYEFHEHLMEPWDGPAALAFTDGVQIGATLDRNGLRPARYIVTEDDLVIMGSEVGAVEIPTEKVAMKGRLQPGKMFLVDTAEGRIISDQELKEQIYQQRPYRQWLDENMILLENLSTPQLSVENYSEDLIHRQKIFGYTSEDINMLLTPMIENGQEATGSMGNDAPLAVLSDRPQLLYGYFKQLFAQVSNPPVDAIREELVMSLTSHLGPEKNILAPTPSHAKLLKLEHPILTNAQMSKIKEINFPDFRTKTLSTVFAKSSGVQGLEKALQALCLQAESAVKDGHALLILTDKETNREWVPIPALLASSAVHQHLNHKKLRSQVGLIIETGEAREVAHFALLIGFGIGAIHPYLAYETIEHLIDAQILSKELTLEKAIENYLKAVKKGLFKIFSKMGISTIQSYRGAQIFEAIGLGSNFVDQYFTGTASRIEGIEIDVVAKETLLRHEEAFDDHPDTESVLHVGGNYFWRRRGEHHQINPLTVLKLQEAAQKNSAEAYKQFSKMINDQSRKRATLRGLLEFKKGNPISLTEVEPAKEIVKRFATGAMSFGSISIEAHSTLAVAMNRIGGKSNSGEGGENPDRFFPKKDGDWENSNIKQVASGRFGVTIEYLVNCNELQIKVAQGAKPGEGGQLPGKKVSPDIAKVRYSTPGVTLISPPPHHDIYSIEDLAELIYDLKNANPNARITVKLVSEAGVGTIAAGVTKAKADMIVIAGHDGGTGASPLTSIKHAGVPWELGISETHQTLILNRLRGRVRLQTDGQLKTGRDVAIAAMLGAEEFGFATAPLVAIGCIMMRKCHLNTCPVGIATQDPILREKFIGQPEHVINYFFFIAEELREIMAGLGIRKMDDLIGRSDLLEMSKEIDHWKAKHLNLSALLHQPKIDDQDHRHCVTQQDHALEEVLDRTLIAKTREAVQEKKPVYLTMPIQNIDRAVGTMLSGTIAQKYGQVGLPDNTIHCKFNGSAGQSFGAFLAHGVTLTLEGDANDYVGKGLSGGRIIVYPPKVASYLPHENILIGNTVLYGATGGEAYFSGIAGERFAVRNSGATAIVEGVGDHGCEYMTGGRVVVIGATGKNFAAGMSGGIAYVYDENSQFEERCNLGMVELETLADHEEEQWLLQMVEQHYRYTQSSKAKILLDHWKETLQKIVKVMPTEYRNILQKMQNQAA